MLQRLRVRTGTQYRYCIHVCDTGTQYRYARVNIVLTHRELNVIFCADLSAFCSDVVTTVRYRRVFRHPDRERGSGVGGEGVDCRTMISRFGCILRETNIGRKFRMRWIIWCRRKAGGNGVYITHVGFMRICDRGIIFAYFPKVCISHIFQTVTFSISIISVLCEYANGA